MPLSKMLTEAFDRARGTGESRAATALRAGRRVARSRDERRGNVVARGLGWFSLGVGVVELAAPALLERAVGLRGPHRVLLPAIGLREIVSGIGILSTRRPLPMWLWARVAGDMVDLAMMLASMRREQAQSPRTAQIPRAAESPRTRVPPRPARTLQRAPKRREKPPRSIAINRSPEDCRRLWAVFGESPRFRRDFASLRSVDFEVGPAGRGTMIRVYMPTGSLTAEHNAQEALRKFKQVVETGEVATTRGQPAGERSLLGKAARSIET